MIDKNFKSGYIALITVIIISGVLLSAIIATSFKGLWTLSNLFNREEKELSYNLSLSCLDQAIVRIIQSPSWQLKKSGKEILIGDFSCWIKSIEWENLNTAIIETEAKVYKTTTSLKSEVFINEENSKINYIKEL